MIDGDKYPIETDRRRFVKGVVGAGVLSTFATVGSAALDLSTAPRGSGGGGIKQYFGIELLDGPAPRGMPQIPVELDDEGYLMGVWPDTVEEEIDGRPVLLSEMELGGITYSTEWFQYCGVQTFPGLAPDADQDDYFTYSDSPYDWQTQDVADGDRVHIDDFADYAEWGNDIGTSGIGKPARVRWRSEDVPSGQALPVLVIRSSVIEELAAGDEWLEASTREGFIAIAFKCTHFCCVPGFKVDAAADRLGVGDDVYCQCHKSVFDPFSIQQQQFVALPREETDTGSGSETDTETEADTGAGTDPESETNSE
jgi:Rieske Fe-S protein